MDKDTQSVSQWDLYAERLRVKLPAAPPAVLDGYVTWIPWLAIVFGALGVLVFLAATVLSAILAPFLIFGGAAAVTYGGMAIVTLVFGLVYGVLDVVGGYLMLNRRLTGWWLLAIGLIVNLLSNLLSASLFGFVITLLIGYVHLLVKPRYT